MRFFPGPKSRIRQEPSVFFQYLDLKNAVEKCNHEEMKIAEEVFLFCFPIYQKFGEPTTD
jgi:hypothetical protein